MRRDKSQEWPVGPNGKRYKWGGKRGDGDPWDRGLISGFFTGMGKGMDLRPVHTSEYIGF